MEQVNLGSLPDGTGGDSIRVGFQKCNDNFTEVAEKLKTAGGGASAEELKQIKDAATALTARVAQLEKAGSGGGVPAGELEELKQQLQQLQTKLTAAEQAAGGAASKATTAQQTAATAQQTATTAQQAASGAAQTANAAKQEAAAATQTATTAQQTAGSAQREAAAVKSSIETLTVTVAELKKSVGKAGAGDGVFVGKIELLSTTADAMPAKWYLATGDKYPANSPQGQALQSLPEAYKQALKVELRDGQINTPNLFHSDGRGYFIRSAKTLGVVQEDAIRNAAGSLGFLSGQFANPNGVFASKPVSHAGWSRSTGKGYSGLDVDFNLARAVPVADENRPLNIGFLPAIYLGV